MLQRALSITCLLLAQYEERFQPTIVYFGVKSSGQYEAGLDCVFKRSHLTSHSLEYILELMKNTFQRRRKFVVVATEQASVHLMLQQTALQRYSASLGFSRWVLHLPEPAHAFLFGEVMQCFLIFVGGTTASLPSDYTNCHGRRHITADRVDEVERFTRKPQNFICSASCVRGFTRKGLQTDHAIKWLSILSASNFSINPHVQYLDRDGQPGTEETVRLLGTRRKDFSFSPFVVSSERTALMVFIAPTKILEYYIFVKRQFHRISRADRLVRLFDGWTWLAIFASAVVQTISIIVVLRRRSSDAAFFVCALLVGQSEQRSLKVSRCLISSLCIVGFVLCSVFRNNLTSSFNVPALLIFDRVGALRRGFNERLLSKVCISRTEFVFKAADANSNHPLLKVLGELRDLNNLLTYDSSAACLDHVTDDPRAAAVLHLAALYVKEIALMSKIRIGEPIPTSLMTSFALPPWSPYERMLTRISRSSFEASLNEVDMRVWTLSTAWKTDPIESLHVLDLSDFRAAFVALFAGFITSCITFELERWALLSRIHADAPS